MDTNMFFPDVGQNYDRFAKEVCGACDVQQECLMYAIDNVIEHGLFGGLSPEGRKRWGAKYRKGLIGSPS
jgi:WhiB family redox-sensing transcriptional regulator